MTDYIAKIAELLKSGETVIFYTVGGDTFLNIRELKARFGLLPTGVCDKDPKKQGRTWKGLEGLIVQSPDEVMQSLPKTYWFIPSVNYRYQIIGYLTQERGIAPSRIVNYEPVRKFRSCQHLNQSITYDRTGKLSFCCRKTCPSVAPEERLNGAAFRKLRDDLLKLVEEDRVPAESLCAGCNFIKEDYYPVEPKGLFISYNRNNVCNYHCCYCTVSHAPEIGKDEGCHTVNEVVTALRQENVLAEDYSLSFATSGEPTLYPGRKEVYQTFDGDLICILTNGFLYDPDLFALLNQKKAYILDSIDAGTSETYRRIKGVDGFERVRQNLKKYAQAAVGLVMLKYIFVPGVNDTPEDVDGFIDLCEETGAILAIAAVDFFSTEKITDHTKNMINRLATGLVARGILCVPYTSSQPVEYAAEIRFLMD